MSLRHLIRFGTPGTSAVADVAAQGTSTAHAKADHKHGRESFGTPVAIGAANANGSSTSLPRADHVHSNVGAGQWLIYDTGNLSGVATTGSITIPATATHLLILGLIRSSANLEHEHMLFRFNGDTATNYSSDILLQDQNSTNYQDYYGAAKDHIPIVVAGSAATVPAHAAAIVKVHVNLYQSTAFDKIAEYVGSMVQSNSAYASANFYLVRGNAFWRPATPAAITSLSMATNSGSNFVSGSQLQVYGII